MFSLCLFDKMVFACQTGPELTMELTQSSKSLCTYPSVRRAGITGSAYSWLLHYHCVSFLMAQRWAGCITFLLVYRIFQNWEINKLVYEDLKSSPSWKSQYPMPLCPSRQPLAVPPQGLSFPGASGGPDPILALPSFQAHPCNKCSWRFSPGEDSPLSESMLCWSVLKTPPDLLPLSSLVPISFPTMKFLLHSGIRADLQRSLKCVETAAPMLPHCFGGVPEGEVRVLTYPWDSPGECPNDVTMHVSFFIGDSCYRVPPMCKSELSCLESSLEMFWSFLISRAYPGSHSYTRSGGQLQ